MPVRGDERRAFGRIELDPPLRGFLDEIPVSVVDASVSGFRVAHGARISPAPTRHIRVEWEEKTMEFGCVVARSTLFRLAQRPDEKSIYHSGVRILEPVGDSEDVLRELIAQRVIRALEEQKANARGIPPLDTYNYQVGKGDRFRRCEMIDGVWRKVETAIRQQPVDGFTVSAEVEAREVDLLCKTYEQTTDEGRRLTKILAQLSISKEEGTGTRRYVP
ncbi:MAG TPA: hypothetical protein VLV78_10025 [Thermoanaerobaculia bacterium]|nr:hypothetical protein [Thermoanaerobaculia bacterium]